MELIGLQYQIRIFEQIKNLVQTFQIHTHMNTILENLCNGEIIFIIEILHQHHLLKWTQHDTDLDVIIGIIVLGQDIMIGLVLEMIIYGDE